MRVLKLNEKVVIDVYTGMACKFKIDRNDKKYPELVCIKAYDFECNSPHTINPYSAIGEIWFNEEEKFYEFCVDKFKNKIESNQIIFNDDEILDSILETACINS